MELSFEAFKNPPPSAGVHVWWHWMDGAISRDGITKDLEVMKAQGVTQATILNIGLLKEPVPDVPHVGFASEKWFEMYRWALTEAARLGITLGVHNCDGWSTSGGPWITPELSMKQYTWTKTIVQGGTGVDVALPQPSAVEGYYKDVAVFAYPTSERASAFRKAGVHLMINSTPAAAEPLIDGSPVSEIPIKQGDQFVFSAAEPFTFSRVALHVRRSFMWSNPTEFTTKLRIEISEDGNLYKEAAILNAKGLNRTQILEVPESSAKCVRVTITDVSQADSWLPLSLSELEFLARGETPAFSPTIPHLGAKTSSVKDAPGAVDTFAKDAHAIPAKDVIDLTKQMTKDGRLKAALPAGSWAIVRFGFTSTGMHNNPATPEGRGLECDKLDSAAVDRHFQAFSQRLIDEAGDAAGKTLRFILIDSWEAGFQNWTARLPEEFRRRRGYDLVPWLPVLTGQVVASAGESEAVLHDFRRTIADLIRENYYDKFAALLHARGIELHAEVIYGGPDYPPLDVMLATEQVDVPMMEFWAGANDDGLVHYTPQQSASYNFPVAAGFGYGKQYIGSEAYTGFAHYSEAPADLEPFGSRAFAAGVNRMILHSSVHQPTDDKPGLTLGEFASHFNRNNLYWPHSASWLEYQARIQSVLDKGIPVFDVLYYIGDQLPQTYSQNSSTTVPAGYALTAINADLLASAVKLVDGRLELNGIVPTLLSLPPDGRLDLASLRRIEQLVCGGAHIYGPRPQSPLTLSDWGKRAEFDALVGELWGKESTASGSKTYHKGLVSWGRTLGDVLQESQHPQFETEPGAPAEFLFTHRQVGDADIFFVANQTDRPLARECVFRVSDRTPQIWNPENGELTRPALFHVEKDRLRLPVKFAPRQSLLFIFNKGLPAEFVTSVWQGKQRLFPSNAGTSVHCPSLVFNGAQIVAESADDGVYSFETSSDRRFDASLKGTKPLKISGISGEVVLKGPGISPPNDRLEIRELRSLTESTVPDIRYFAGEATYHLNFKIDDREIKPGDRLLLDLGGFESIATATLNGHPLGQFWKPGMPIDATRFIQARNELTVQVVNVYRNRFIGDLAEFGEIRHLRTSSPIAKFLSATSPLKPSGWWGPISLTRVPAQTLP